MNKKILLLLPALTLVLAGCNNQNKGKSTPSSGSEEVVGVESVTVAPATLTLEAEQSAILAATVKPITVLNKDVVWSTNNPTVATVDASGKVTAVGEGTAVITATSDADESKKGTCTVTVTEPLFRPIKNPVLEKTFKFGTYQENLKKRIFFNGEEEAYPRLHTTDVYDEAVDVYFEAVDGKEGKYYVAFGEGSEKKHIGLSANVSTDTSKTSYRLGTVGTHKYQDEPQFEITEEQAEWDWDAINYTIKQTRDGKDYFPGTYNRFETISGCAYEKLADDFVFQFLTVSKPTILGNDYVIPGMSTQLSVALPADVTDTPVWSLEGDPVGVTVSQSGLVEATTEAVDGTQFNVKVVVGEYAISYPMKVAALNLGTLDDPIDTAEAKHNIDLVGTTGVMYIKGTVAKNTAFDNGTSNQYWQQVWLDGDTPDTGFEGYKLKLDSANEEWKYVFAETDSMVGVEVVISGRGTTHNDTYETDGTETSKLMKVNYEHSSTIAINPAEDFSLVQGGNKQLKAVFEAGKYDAALWSVAPVSPAAADKMEIDEHTGVLTCKSDAVVNSQYTVTAKLYSDPSVEDSVTVTVAEPEPLTDVITFSFADRTEKGTYLDSLPNGETAADFMKQAAGNSEHVLNASAATVSSGNNSGSQYGEAAGMLKFGTSSKAGTLTIYLDSKVNKVVINCEDWQVNASKNTWDGAKLAVNGGTAKAVPTGTPKAPGNIEFSIEDSNVISIVSTKRPFVFSITVSYVD